MKEKQTIYLDKDTDYEIVIRKSQHNFPVVSKDVTGKINESETTIIFDITSKS